MFEAKDPDTQPEKRPPAQDVDVEALQRAVEAAQRWVENAKKEGVRLDELPVREAIVALLKAAQNNKVVRQHLVELVTKINDGDDFGSGHAQIPVEE